MLKVLWGSLKFNFFDRWAIVPSPQLCRLYNSIAKRAILTGDTMMDLIKTIQENELFRYAMRHAGTNEIDNYAKNYTEDKIDNDALKDFLIGKIGCDKDEVNTVYRATLHKEEKEK
tara:strand:+ start:2058 stop:2405 length:348 start_codon:yes stop_codon:yes gene_type:complete